MSVEEKTFLAGLLLIFFCLLVLFVRVLNADVLAIHGRCVDKYTAHTEIAAVSTSDSSAMREKPQR